MAPTRRNGVSFARTGPDSGDRRAGKRAHSAPGRDATLRTAQLNHILSKDVNLELDIAGRDEERL